MIWIGIDPGTHTGLAIWDSEQSRFLVLATMSIHRALLLVHEMVVNRHSDLQVVFEDARQRTWFGKGDVSAKMQGAGSVKRDCTIWEDFCKDCGITYWAKPPTKGTTKVSSEYFKTISHWEGRTSEHSRDAAMLVIGR